MLNQLKTYLFIKDLDPEIERRIDLDNMKFCRILSVIVMILEAIMLIRYGCFGNRSSDWYVFRIYCYIGYFTASAIYFFLSGYAINNVTCHKHFITIGLSYCAASVIWSMFISVVDYINGEQVFVFLTIVICIAGFAFLKPVVSTLFFTVFFAAFYVTLLFVDGAKGALLTNYIVLWLMLMFTCVARYHTKLSDTTARVEYEKLNQKLKKMSLYDELTKVKNRHCLSLDLQAFVGKRLFLMLIDIDGFKKMNDTYGHDSGDCVLKQFAQILQKYFSSQNVYRYGGDEFLAVVCDCQREIIIDKIKHCQEDMSALRIGDTSFKVAFSGGYLIGKMDNKKEFKAMLKSVDIALYQSKRNGKNQMTCAKWENKKG